MSFLGSQLDVVNYALSEIGTLPVTSVNDNQKAQIINAKINILFPMLLTSCNWTFAIKYVFNNTPNTVPFSPDYQFAFQLPPDYGKFYKFATNVYPLVYAIVDGLLLTNINPISYYYIVNNVPFNNLTYMFYRALAIYAASDCCYVLTNNEKLAAYLQQKYKDARDEAILQNDMERDIVSTPYNDFDRQVFI